MAKGTGAARGKSGGHASALSRSKSLAKTAPKLRVLGVLPDLPPNDVGAHFGQASCAALPEFAAGFVSELIDDVVSRVVASAALDKKTRKIARLVASAAAGGVASSLLSLQTAFIQRPGKIPLASTGTPLTKNYSRAKLSRVPHSGLHRAINEPIPPRSTATGKKRHALTSITEHTQATHPSSTSTSMAKRSRASVAAFSTTPRGATVAVQPSVRYAARSDYSWNDVCAAGALVEDGKIKKADLELRDKDGKLRYNVPRTTMLKWLEDDATARQKVGKRGVAGTPHWRVERDVRRRTKLNKPGPGPLLGSAEDLLMLRVGRMALANTPYEEEEIEEMLRDTAITLDLKTKQGRPYDRFSNVTELMKGFRKRCIDEGVIFVVKGGQKLSQQRWWNTSPAVLTECAPPPTTMFALAPPSTLSNHTPSITTSSGLGRAQILHLPPSCCGCVLGRGLGIGGE